MKQFLLLLIILAFNIACKKELAKSDNTESISSIAYTNAKAISIPSVTICNQTWMQKNLEITTYRNGDAIPQVTNPAEWFALTTGAWCYYNNDPANGSVYCKLYNWYAGNDPRGLAPAGWHIPSNAEWTILTDCLGGITIAGGKLKEKGLLHWNTPNTDATNKSRFTAVPGGNLVSIDGLFFNKGLLANFWSSTSFSITAAYYRRIVYNNGTIQSFGGAFNGDGFSVRCIKD